MNDRKKKDSRPVNDSAPGLSGLPERLRRMREREKMSQTRLSECCGLGKNTVATYEAGQKLPSAASLVQLADFFDGVYRFPFGKKKLLNAPSTVGDHQDYGEIIGSVR